MGRRWMVAALAGALLVSAGCGERAGQAPAPPRPDTAVPDDAVVQKDEVRRVTVDVPGDYDLQIVEFADADRGFAQFVRCEPATVAGQPGRQSCHARVFATHSGGRAWREIRHPRPDSENPQLYTGADGTLILLSEPHGWYVSTDLGRSFTTLTYRGSTPEAYHAAVNGRFWLECEGVPACRVVEQGSAGHQPVPSQPELPGSLSAAAGGTDGRLWATALDGDRVHAAMSSDGGRNWRAYDVGTSSRGPIMITRLLTSADGEDAWLLAYPEPTGGTGGGRTARALRKEVGVPDVWAFGAAGWTAVRTDGIVDKPASPVSLAAAGSGTLAVTSADGLGYLTRTGYAHSTGAPRMSYVRALADGTLFGVDESHRTYYLAVGTGPRHGWAEVALEFG